MNGCVRVAAVCSLVLGLGACGNTISGLGKDISSAGDKMSAWQERKAVAETQTVGIVKEKVQVNAEK